MLALTSLVRPVAARLAGAVAALSMLGLGGSALAGAPAPVDIRAELDRSVMLSGQTQTAFLRVSVTPARRPGTGRAPMNVALVIDRSGSMAAQARMENARRAALMAVDRLGRDDVLAVVSYDDRVEVDVPASKLVDRTAAKARIERLKPRGSTAIHAALLAGAEEVRKFKSKDRINRIVLLSDGLANVGPSAPEDFVGLGHELSSEGITVSTIGLGTSYNEDLMAGLARAADGGHVFVQESADLTAFLAREFDDVASTVGQEVQIIIKVKPGVRPLRSLGRAAQIEGNRIVYQVGTLIGGVEQVLLAEIEVSADAARGAEPLAEVEVAYTDAATGTRQTADGRATSRFESDKALVAGSANATVLRDVTTLVSRETRAEAVKLRDAGRLDEARKKFEANAAFLRQQKEALPGAAAYEPLVRELKASEAAAAPAAQSSEGWSRARKVQRATDGHTFGSQSKY